MLESLQYHAQILADRFSESAVSGTVTYKAFTGTTYNSTTGQDLAAYTESTLNAVVRIYSPREINDSHGRILEGDREFTITTEDLTSIGIKDQIVYSSTTYNVIFWEKNQPAVQWQIMSRAVKGD